MSRTKPAPATYPARYVRPAEIYRRFPKLTGQTLQAWYARCSLLGRPVRTLPDKAAAGNRRLISLTDVAAAIRWFRDELPPAFTDPQLGELISVEAFVAERGIPARLPYRWAVRCPLVPGGKLPLFRFRVWEVFSRRAYLRKSDADTLARLESPPFLEEGGSLTHDQMLEDFDTAFIARYFDPGTRRRKHRAQSHPVLGRPGRAEFRPKTVTDRAGRSATVFEAFYSRADRDRILAVAPPDPCKWGTLTEAMKVGGITLSQLDAAVKAGRIDVLTDQFVPRGPVRTREKQTYYSLEDARAEGQRVRSLLRPGDPRRIFEQDGYRWMPEFETRTKLGLNGASLQRMAESGTEHLDGRKLVRKKFARPLWKAREESWHYRADQVEAIYARMNSGAVPPGSFVKPAQGS